MHATPKTTREALAVFAGAVLVAGSVVVGPALGRAADDNYRTGSGDQAPADRGTSHGGTPTSTDQQQPSDYPADNTGRNMRDWDADTPTADRQSNAAGDVELTRRIRQAIVNDKSLSTSAHNVKIVAENGVVTLRGPVVSEKERDEVAAAAKKVSGVKRVDNRLDVASR